MTHISTELTYPATAAACALVASVFDVRSRRIPNFLTFPSFFFGLLLHLVLGGWKSMLLALAGGVICGVIFLLFYIAGGMGAGDVKLIMAVGCIAGFSHIAYIMVLTALSGGVMAVGFAWYRGRLQETLMNVGDIAAHHRQQGLTPHPDLNIANVATLRLPYALAIASGTLLTFYFQLQ